MALPQSSVLAPLKSSRKRQQQPLRWVLLLPALLVIGGVIVYPMLSSLITSFRSWQLIVSPTPGPFVGLDNYTRAFTDSGFINSLGVSGLYMLLSVPLSVVLGLAIALILAKPTRLNTFARALLIFPFAVAPILKGYSWRFMLNPDYGVYANLIGDVFPPLKGFLWLGHDFSALLVIAFSEVWGWAPLFALMFIGALGSIPSEVTEAARVDGANSFQIFWRITLPLLAPVITIVALLKIISAFKMFDQVAVMTGGGPGDSTQTLYYYVYQLAFRNLDMGYASAVSYILVILMGVLAFLYVRLLMRRN